MWWIPLGFIFLVHFVTTLIQSSQENYEKALIFALLSVAWAILTIGAAIAEEIYARK